MLSAEDVEKIKGIKGEVRGVAFQTDAKFIIKKYSESGLQKIEDELNVLNFNISYRSIRAMEWLPLRLRVLSFLVIRDIFDWTDKDYKEMGYEGPRHSFIIRILGRFLSSPRDTFLSSPKYWEKHYTVGVLYPQVLNEIERYAVLKLKDFNVPSFYCRYLEGYFSCLLQYQFPNRTVRSEEVRCINKGDPYHEFRFTW